MKILNFKNMRKILLSLAAFLLIGSLSAQNVARECVLFEVFTGVNCPYCPAAANGIAQMLEEGLAIAPMGYQTSAFSTAEFYTAETNARAAYYNISAYPTARVDGVSKYEGGGTASQTLYSQYKNLYNQRINETSPFTIDLSFSYYAGTQCQATAVVTKVGECTATNVKVFIVLTESHIQRNWQGMTELNCCVRDMIPDQLGTAFTGESMTVTGLFDMSGFKKENCQLIAWVQNYAGTKEVYQAVKLNIAESGADYDIGIQNVEGATPSSCSGKMNSTFEFRNFGNQTITSVDFIARDENDNKIGEYAWTGNLAKDGIASFVMPEIDFSDASQVVVEATNINGSHDDEYPFDNFYSMDVTDAYVIEDGYLKVQVKTGSNPQNLAIEFIDTESGNAVETLTYDQANHAFTNEVNLPASGCYCIRFSNAVGNGMDGGFFEIKDSKNNKIITCKPSDNIFDYVYNFEVNYSPTGVNEVNDNEHVGVYPNPVSSKINIVGDVNEVKIYNAIGQVVYSNDGELNGSAIDATSFANGLYIIELTDANGEKSSQKIVVDK